MAERYIILYGLSDARDIYRVVRYERIPLRWPKPMLTIKNMASLMCNEYPAIKEVYAIDSSEELYQAYRETIVHFGIESHIIFKSFLEEEGVRII